MSRNNRTYAIVGAGFSGMAVAVQLLQRLQAPARICLINRSLSFGRGLAYGTNSPSHLLNVPAGRMSIDPEHESGFVDYLQGRGLPYKGGDFVPRSLYGDYLERCLLKAQASAAEGVRLEMIESEVLRLETQGDGEAPVLHLANGRAIEASEVVLALGNFTPKPPHTLRVIDWNQPPLVNDVWAHGVLDGLPRDASVLLVGTGLTAYDAVLRLLDQKHEGPITMLSRRALLPQPHRDHETPPASGLVPAGFLAGEANLRAALRATRELLAKAAGDGHDWRDVIGGLRPITPRLWQQLDAKSKKQFLRHVGPHWDTHRHRAAPAIWRRIEGALEPGQLRVVAGRLVDIEVANPELARVTWRARGANTTTSSEFRAVVNCTGPSSDLRSVADPFIAQLRDGRQLEIDPFALGLSVDSEYRVVRADGAALKNVRYVGPLLKAQRWEATAVPELRLHSREVALSLAAVPPPN
ncbi:MAG TPA: FAD/NAD(P)-binding protein [Ramlibacter sp.]|nr:FAD/NAD(P)-binding protein [Ramlibacter sp.]